MPYEQTDLTARVVGYVRKINVDIGDRVKGPRYDSNGRQVEEGQVLAELWLPEMVEELKQKEALIAQAKVDVKQSEAAWAVAAANVKTAEAAVREAEAGRVRAVAQETLWTREHQRLRRLTSGVVTETDVDKARMEMEAAQAMRGEVEAKVLSMKAARDESAVKRDKAEADVAAAKARIPVAEANRDQVRAMLQYAKLTAPYDGVITKLNVHTGAYITDRVGQQPLFTIVRTDKLRVTVDVPERDVRFLKAENVVQVDLDALPGKKFACEISRFAPVLGAGKKVRVEVHIPNADGALYPGMYGHAVVVLEHKKRALTVPTTCLSTDEKGPFVFTVVDGKAKQQHVGVGINDGRKAEITSGLTGGEEIIAAGKDLVHDDQSVTAKSSLGR
jgi:RND family efflux transporter MFP subunit